MTLAFLYHDKLRLVEPVAIKRGKYNPLLIAKTRDGKTKAFKLGEIEALTQEQEDMLNGVTTIPFALFPS